MGLAASQSRFLGLTARKSNVEYQGQQINQARTALSNEVMGLYQKYNNLKVPTPPSIEDFTKTTYTLDSADEDYSIGSFTKITDGLYKGYYDVRLDYTQETAKAYPKTIKDTVLTTEKDDQTGEYTNIVFDFGVKSYYYKKDDDTSTLSKITDDYEKYPGLTTCMKEWGVEDGTFYMFKLNDIAYFTREQDIDDTAFDTIEGKKQYYGSYTFEYQGIYNESKSIGAKAALTQGSDGRLASIQIISCDDDEDLVGHSYSLTVGQSEDQDKYTDAMNQYHYKKQLYENEVEKINKKTEKIQTQDKALELKLSQLDTEQNAISTEMDSISKVIEDTIESVFKTFNS